MHPAQCSIIASFLEFFLIQSQKEYEFDIKDVVETTMNNDALYVILKSGEQIVIQLFGKV